MNYTLDTHLKSSNSNIPINESQNNFEQTPSPVTASVNRLNALDSTLLENSAYKNLDDDSIKTEYRIEKLESDLTIINKQISAAKEINNTQDVDMLNLKKHAIESELAKLYNTYNGGRAARKLSSSITSIVKPKENSFEKISNKTTKFISRNVLSKISKRFSSGRTLETALNKVENINQDVNMLISNQTPYGEAEDKYDKLTNYFTKANTIQYRVSRDLSTNTKISKNPFAPQTSKEKALEEEVKLKVDEAKKSIAKKNNLNLNNNLKKAK